MIVSQGAAWVLADVMWVLMLLWDCFLAYNIIQLYKNKDRKSVTMNFEVGVNRKNLHLMTFLTIVLLVSLIMMAL